MGLEKVVNISEGRKCPRSSPRKNKQWEFNCREANKLLKRLKKKIPLLDFEGKISFYELIEYITREGHDTTGLKELVEKGRHKSNFFQDDLIPYLKTTLFHFAVSAPLAYLAINAFEGTDSLFLDSLFFGMASGFFFQAMGFAYKGGGKKNFRIIESPLSFL